MTHSMTRTQLKVLGGIVAVVIPLCTFLSFSTILETFVVHHKTDQSVQSSTLPHHLSDMISASATSVPHVSLSRGLVKKSPEEVPLCWLMSFPRSGQSYLMDLIQHSVNTTVATNYGTVVVNADGSYEENAEKSSENPYATRFAGPFLYGRGLPDGFCPPEHGFLLTRTHCGGFCLDCRPMGYVIKPKVFKRECAAGVAHDGRTGKTHPTAYDFNMVKRAVHLFRDPFDVVVSRYFHTWTKCRDDNDVDFLDKYPQSIEGFRKWCFDRDTNQRLLEQEKRWYNPPDYENAMAVRCHAEFYKYVQWHNNTFLTTDRFQLPSLVMHYGDFDVDFDGTFKKLTDHVGLTANVVNDPPPFYHKGNYAQAYFTKQEREAVSIFMHSMASNRTWAQVKRYMYGLEELGLQ